jgi:hypothetical protein
MIFSLVCCKKENVTSSEDVGPAARETSGDEPEYGPDDLSIKELS